MIAEWELQQFDAGSRQRDPAGMDSDAGEPLPSWMPSPLPRKGLTVPKNDSREVPALEKDKNQSVRES